MDSSSKNALLTEAGRNPWYLPDGTCNPAFVVGLAGGSASGKTSLAKAILHSLALPWVLLLSQDSYYKTLTPEQSQQAFENTYNFDSPDSFDHAKMIECVRDLKGLKSAEIPIYSFVKHQRLPETQYLYGGNIIIVEGIFVLHDPVLRNLLDLKIFVQCDSDLMLARRIKRDTVERGRDVAGILDQYLRFVKPSYDDFVQPTAKHADIIVPGASNSVAIDLITTHIRRQLEARKLKVRAQLSRGLPGPGNIDGWALPANVIVMRATNQLRGIHTILRDSTTSKDDFVFFTKRLANLLIEESLELMAYSDKEITTRAGHPYHGKRLATEHLSALTILRSGEVLERGLRRVLRDTPLGSVLIQTDHATGEPLLYSLSLPKSLKVRETARQATVLVLDSQIGTGAAALMAIRVLLDHGVEEANIILCVFLLSRKGGVHSILQSFPRIRILTSAVDEGLEKHFTAAMDATTSLTLRNRQEKTIWAITPGFGSFGDRFF